MLLGPDREVVLTLLGEFESALVGQDPRSIAAERARISEIARRIEAGLVH
ncbi:hypothetical protein [Oceanicola sp. S124]|nr:hypothetical protein [Oceanicola sp. S124]